MKNINYYSIEFKNMGRLVVNTRSKLFLDSKNLLYKIFNDNDVNKLKIKSKKIELFSNIRKSYINSPKSKITEHNIFRGYTSKYINGTCLSELDQLQFAKALLETSKRLSDIHELKENIVVGDMHFKNVIVDKNLKPHFIDVDSYGIDKYESDDIPLELYIYCKIMNYKIEKNQDYDRLSFVLSTFKTIFKDNLINVSPMDYKFASKKYSFLDNEKIESLYLKLRSEHSSLPDVPYIYELTKE